MACGIGACLGCTCETKGQERVQEARIWHGGVPLTKTNLLGQPGHRRIRHCGLRNAGRLLIGGIGPDPARPVGNKGDSGLINSIGLQNPGVQHFIDVELPEMLELKQKYGTVAIANLRNGRCRDAERQRSGHPEHLLPKRQGGTAWPAAGEVVRMVRAACKKPPS